MRPERGTQAPEITVAQLPISRHAERTLYRGCLEADDWLSIEVFGRTYHLPPDGPGKHPAPKTPEDRKRDTWEGTITITDVMGVPIKDPETRPKLARDKNARKTELLHTSADILQSILARYGHCGLVELVGDQTDTARKTAAQTTWLAHRVKQADDMLAAFRADAARQPHGQNVMGSHQRQAQEFMDDYNSGVYANVGTPQQRLGFVCPENCGYATDDQAKFVRHMAVTHKKDLSTEPAEPTPGLVEPRQHKRGPRTTAV